MGQKVTLRIWRGEGDVGEHVDYDVELEEGMVVLDVIHGVQDTVAPDLAVRWNCKAGKCGSCSAEIDGHPGLLCMTRMDDVIEAHKNPEEPITVSPMHSFPNIRDLVTDVTWNYEVNKRIPQISGPRTPGWIYSQTETDRLSEFRQCIECFLCQDTCHVLREHRKYEEFAGPRFFVRLANLDMHPMDEEDRIGLTKDVMGLGYCNITKCCTEVCPAGIRITDNAIIPLKERVVDRYYSIPAIARRLMGKGPAPPADGSPLPGLGEASGNVLRTAADSTFRPIELSGDVVSAEHE